jgi:hypothetical protein
MPEQDFSLTMILIRFLEGPDQGVVRCDSTKLMKMGSDYVYDENKILDDSVACGANSNVMSINPCS